MDILAILGNRLDFIQRFYDQAATPFETTKQKIEAEEKPFVPQYEPGDYDGFEYESEWIEADDCLRGLGHCSLGWVEKALHDYLREFIMREAELRDSSAVLDQYSGSWFKKYCDFLAGKTHFKWSRSPVPYDRIEQINLSRNDITHDPMIDSTWPRQSMKHFRKHPVSAFADELARATLTGAEGTPEFPLPINVTRQKLTSAIEDVRQFCRFVEAQRTK